MPDNIPRLREIVDEIEDIDRMQAIYRSLVQSSSCIVYAVTIDDDEIIIWNPEAERIFGWKAKEILGQKFEDFLVPKSFSYLNERRKVIQQIKRGKGIMFETERLTKDGTAIKVQISASPVYDFENTLFAISTIAIPIK